MIFYFNFKLFLLEWPLYIKKNFSIVCFNEKQGFGNGFVIPAGPLRENLSALKRVDCIVINGEKNINIENKIYNKNADFVFALRYGKNAGSKDDTWLTYLGNRIFTNLGKILFNMKNNDILHTFFICKTKKFKTVKSI